MFELVRSPEMTLCGWWCCTPSINQSINQSKLTRSHSSRDVNLLTQLGDICFGGWYLVWAVCSASATFMTLIHCGVRGWTICEWSNFARVVCGWCLFYQVYFWRPFWLSTANWLLFFALFHIDPRHVCSVSRHSYSRSARNLTRVKMKWTNQTFWAEGLTLQCASFFLLLCSSVCFWRWNSEYIFHNALLREHA